MQYNRLLLVTVACAFVGAARGVTVTIDKVQQRYPWNGIVDIDYTVAYETGEAELKTCEDKLRIAVVDETVVPPTTNLVNTFSPMPMAISAGRHRIAWDANADGHTFVSSNVSAVATLRHYAPKYMVVDISGGPDATDYPVTYLSGEPNGGFNVPEYKGDKMVFRLLPPGSYVMGSPATEKLRNSYSTETQMGVTLTKPFYMGIFEVTQKQFANVTGLTPSKYAGDCRPVETVSFETIRGKSAKPESADVITAGSFMGRLRARTGLAFDLPTDAQWEYACRAGTVTPFNDGKVHEDKTYETTYSESMHALGRYSGDTGDGRGGGEAEHTVVGCYDPNAWGLYDMHGNVQEWCFDWWCKDPSILGQVVDPVGDTTGTVGTKVRRGGAYSTGVSNCRAAHRYGDYGSGRPSSSGSDSGFRVSLTVD